MTYEELFNEIREAVWSNDDNNNGIVFQWHDPFHNSLGKIESDENLRIQHLFHKFADKLYLDTKDENIAKILHYMCIFIGEAYTQTDIIESGAYGTKYDPECMFDKETYDCTKAVEPKLDPTYEVRSKEILKNNGDTLDIREDVTAFSNYQSALNYFNELVGFIRKRDKDFSGDGESVLLKVNEEAKVVTFNGSTYEIVKIEH